MQPVHIVLDEHVKQLITMIDPQLTHEVDEAK